MRNDVLWRCVGALAVCCAGPASAQAPDSLRHPETGGMSWGRETFLLAEVLDYAPSAADRGVDLDLLGWTGGAIHRLWGKVGGRGATVGGGMLGEYQLLYGRLISAWWDAQVGVRVDQKRTSGASATRAGAVVGLQGLAPGWFELEPSLFLTTTGNLSFDLTASYDMFVTQRVVLQPRLESTVALRDEAEFGLGRGLSDASLGLRARVELRREFTPYVGVVWDRNYGRAATIARQAGDAPGERRMVAGLRLWW